MNPLVRMLMILLVLLGVSCGDQRGEVEKAMYPEGTPPGVEFVEHSAGAEMEQEPKNKDGQTLLQELVRAAESSDRIVAIEHSYVYDTGDASKKLVPERMYKTVVLTAADKAALVSALASTDPHVSGIFSACIFEPHHRLEFYEGPKMARKLEICFGCGELEWSGSQASVPNAVYNTFDAFVRRIGMLPDQDWEALARRQP
jgi:hypothetical protein